MWEQERPTAHACNIMFVVRGLQLERPRETRTERFVDDIQRAHSATLLHARERSHAPARLRCTCAPVPCYVCCPLAGRRGCQALVLFSSTTAKRDVEVFEQQFSTLEIRKS